MSSNTKKNEVLKPLLKTARKSGGNGCKTMSCLVCGNNEPSTFEPLSDNLFRFLTQTGTIHSLSNPIKLIICSSCAASAALMEQACCAQVLLAEKFQSRSLGGRNGVRNKSVTAQLLKPGNAVNLPGNLHAKLEPVADTNEDDGFKLLISNVQGGLDQLCVFDEDVIQSEYFKTQATDTTDLVEQEVINMECEIFEQEAAVEIWPVVWNASPDPITEILKPPSTPYDIPGWLPATGTSERSFTSSHNTETTNSSVDREILQPKLNSGWKCPMCEKSFDTSPLLVEHVHSAHSEIKAGDGMTCPFCKKQFPSYTQLDDHITKLHGDGSHSCQGCYTVFQRPTLLRRHQQYCEHYKVYMEKKKQASLKGSDDEEESVSEDTKEGTSTCSLCLIMFSSTVLLSEHIRDCHTNSLSRKYNCEGCKAGFDILRGLYAHQSECMVFSGLKKTSNNSQYSVQFSCHGCKEVISSYVEFQNHKQTCLTVKDILNCEGAKQNSLNTAGVGVGNGSSEALSSDVASDCHAQVSTSQNNQYKCTECQESFISKDILDTHQSNCKGRSSPGTNEFPCTECLITFEYKCLVDFHMLIHKDCEKKPHRCAGCKAGFAAHTHKVSHEQKCGKLSLMNKDLNKDSDIPTAGNTDLEIKLQETSKASDNPSTCVKSEPMDLESSNQITMNLTESAKPFRCKACPEQFSFFCDFENHLKICVQSAEARFQLKQESELMQEAMPENSSELGLALESRSSSSLDLLINVNYSDTNVVCPICGVDVKDKNLSRKARRHIIGHDEPFRRYRCNACNWGCDRRSSFTFHSNECKLLLKMYPATSLQVKVRCPGCFVNFSSIRRCKDHFLLQHIGTRSHNGGLPSCDGCMAQYSLQRHLTRHQNECFLFRRSGPISGGNGGRRCGICDLEFTSFGSHIDDFHSFKSLNDVGCIVCNTAFTNIDDLIIHVNTNCSLTSCLLADIKGKKLSSELMNGDLEEPDYSDKESLFSEGVGKGDNRQCQICGCSNKSEKHMEIHVDAESKPYRCPGCNGGFKTFNALQSHEQRCVPFKNKKMLDLAVNDTSTPVEEESAPLHSSTDRPNDIELPLDIDSGQFSLTCATCQKEHSNAVELTNHILTQHTKTKHTCRTCTKSFVHKESLKEHELYCGAPKQENLADESQHLIISGYENDNDEADEWKCLSCCVKFRDETLFLLHIASHEVSNVNKCYLCQATFKSAADICMHMVKYHKLYLTTGLKTEDENNDESDKDSDEDSDYEVTTSQSHSNRQSRVSNRATVLEQSPKLLTKPKSPVRSDKALTKFREQSDSAVKCREEYQDTGRLLRASRCKITGTTCLICNRTFRTNALLKRHYGIHDGSFPGICLVCGIGFGKIGQLKIHKARVHKTPKSNCVICTKCDGVFDQKFRLLNHMELCICPKNDSVIQCLLCTRTFENWHKLKSHIWTHINKCTYCDEKFTVYRKKLEHMITCAQNPLNSDSKSRPLGLRQPVAIKEAPVEAKSPVERSKGRPKAERKKYKCKECCAVYVTMKSLKRHELLHEQAEYRCRICGGKFVSLLAKNRHILREHQSTNKIIKAAVKKEPTSDIIQPVEPVIQKTYYACDKCDTCYSSKDLKDEHERVAHATPVKAFNCKVCDKRFPSKFARRRHMQKFHSGPDSQMQSLACHICGKRFPSNFAKQQHLKKIHNLTNVASIPAATQKRRICKLCGATFEHKAELKLHRRTEHAQEMKGDSIDLANHMLVFGDSKPEMKVRTCKLCGLTFPNKAELKTHVRSVHHEPTAAPTIDTIRPNTFSECSATSSLEYTATLLGPSPDDANAVYSLTNCAAPDEKRGKIRMCKECNQTFSSKSELKAHRRAEHKESKQSLFTFTGETLQMLERKSSQNVIDISSDWHESEPSKKKMKFGVPSATIVIPSAPAASWSTPAVTPSAPAVTPSAPARILDVPDGAASAQTAAQATESKLPFKCGHCSKSFKLRISLNQHHTKAHPWIP